jgi:hypothetical protein
VARIDLDGFGRVPDLVMSLARDGVRLTRVEPHVPTLEDLYFAVRTKKAIADDGGSPAHPVRPATSVGTRPATRHETTHVTDRTRQVAALTGWPGSEG